MADKEMQAHEFVRWRNWPRAVALYDQILATPVQLNNRTQKDRHIVCLLGRCECLLELGKYDLCLNDARKVLNMLVEQQAECLASVSRTRRWLVHSLCKLKKYPEAEKLLSEWILELHAQQGFVDICKTLERYKFVIQMLTNPSLAAVAAGGGGGGNKSAQKLNNTRLEDEMSMLDTKLDHWATNNLPLDKYSKNLSNKGIKKRSEQQQQQQQQQQNSTAMTNGPAATPTSIANNSSSNNTTTITAIMQKNNDLLAALKVTPKNGEEHASTAGASNSSSSAAADSATTTTCSYCAITFQTRNELRQHCQTEAHQNVIMSDEGRDWKWRPPPRGFTLDSYSKCESWLESQSCHYGNQCVEAHGNDELNEWKERFEYRRMRLQKACEKELYGKSYTEEILERWIQSTAPEKIMCEKLTEGIDVICEQDLVTSISSKTSKREWLFVLRTNGKPLKAVALLQDAHRSHFAIKSIKLGDSAQELELKTNQEWLSSKHSAAALYHSSSTTSSSSSSSSSSCSNSNASSATHAAAAKTQDKDDADKSNSAAAATSSSSSISTLSSSSPCSTASPSSTKPLLEHQVCLEFHTEIYGTFRQAICFDFGTEPLLVRHLCVDVVPVSDAEKIEEIKRDIINSSATRWDVSNTNLSKFETTIGSHIKTEAYLNDVKHEKEMLERYPCPRAQTFTLTQSTILEKRLTQNNYRSRIHELLYVEEIARYEQIARFNLRTKLKVTSNYILTPAGMATSTAKYSLAGELFALMNLGKDVSEDTSAGRLILSNCSSVYISAPEDPASANLPAKDKKQRAVYEALIEDKGKNEIYLKLSAKCVENMKLKSDTEVSVDIQFQLNRLPYCEWHHAVDKITDFKLIFPATEIEPNIPWTPKKQWSETCEPKLNAKQREAVNAITTSLSIKLPPILLIGPFGTGKTYTLAQAIKQLLTQPEAKILICTHSNSAADLYIKEYLHPWIEAGLEEATPLRVYYHKRWVATVNSVVQKYCITDGVGNFRRPTVEDIMKHRIVVVTLSISMELANLDLPKGYFTHIFLDEAAQAMECEAIMPLALANDSTRIVLAGDHMQMSPELFSAFAKERKLHISLLERLYDHFPSNFPCKILLCENYRAHEAIIKFTSELFYEQKLIASGKQPRHEKFYPLTFFTTRGEDIQDKNSTAFYNNAEVYEVVERVCELRKKWPSAWGKVNDASIGIMTPYADQVFRIRSELRKRRMGGISVERVLNVQGKQFRAIFLSTVRTRRTCLPNGAAIAGSGGEGIMPGQTSNNLTDDADYGFLSNSKLLNTAITRAQSLVAVVGDPVALCSIGRCRKVWERFIEICHDNKSLFGITMWQLRSQLDGVELKRNYVLNPLAPIFIPRSLQPEAYLRDQTAMYLAMAAANQHHHHPMGPHGGHHHGHAGGMGPPHPGMMAGGAGGGGPMGNVHHGGGPMPPQMYGPHSAASYNAAAAAMMNQNVGGPPGKAGHHFHGHPNHMPPMRAIGPPPGGVGPQQQPQQPPPSMSQQQQQFNTRGPPPPPPSSSSSLHLGPAAQNSAAAAAAAGQYSQYMSWQHQQHSQLRPPPGGQQQGGLPNAQNPNASLWGPPPQTNPWTVLPKQPPNLHQQAANANVPPPNSRQMPSQSNAQNMRGNSVPIQPSAMQQQSQQPPHQPQAMRNNPNDLGYLANKALYGGASVAGKQHPGGPAGLVGPQQVAAAPQPHGNFPAFGQANIPPPPPQMMNQRNLPGIPNGPISPMDPYLSRPPPTSGSSVTGQNAFFVQNNFAAGPPKDKEYQYLNNVHIPLNMQGTMYQQPPIPPPPPNAMHANNVSKQQSPTSLRFSQPPHDYAQLLPPNVNIYEMAFEPKESQYKWYLKLLETQGQEAANKFTEVLRQVSTMIQQQQQHTQQQVAQPPPPQQQSTHGNKLPQHMPQAAAHMNVVASQQQQQQQQQLMQRDPFMPPLLNYSQQQQQQQGQTPRNAMNPFINQLSSNNSNSNLMAPHPNHPHAPPSSLTALNDELAATAALDGNINFNQQIDMVFNSIINGNEISQPILRDLFGVAGGSGGGGSNIGNNSTSSMNGTDLLLNSNISTSAAGLHLSASKMFPSIVGGNGGGVQAPNGLGPPPPPPNSKNAMTVGLSANMLELQQQQQQHQPSPQQMNNINHHQQQQQAFMGNNALLNSKEFLIGNAGGGGVSSSSVPLYRRQALAMGNGHGMNNSAAGNATNANNPLAGNGGHGLNASTPDNILGGGVGGDNILAGLTSGSTTLMEALLSQQENQQHPAHSQNSLQKLFFNNFNASGLKNDLDLFISNNAAFGGLNDGGGFHMNTNFQQANPGLGGGAGGPPPTQQQQQQQQQQQSSNEIRNTTYASVLSQGPQQQQQQQDVGGGGGGGVGVMPQHHHPNFQQNSMGNNGFGALGIAVSGMGAGNHHHGDGVDKDPFAAIRELGQGTNGFYNYFQ